MQWVILNKDRPASFPYTQIPTHIFDVGGPTRYIDNPLKPNPINHPSFSRIASCTIKTRHQMHGCKPPCCTRLLQAPVGPYWQSKNRTKKGLWNTQIMAPHFFCLTKLSKLFTVATKLKWLFLLMNVSLHPVKSMSECVHQRILFIRLFLFKTGLIMNHQWCPCFSIFTYFHLFCKKTLSES